MMKMERGKMYYDWVTENMKEGTKIGLDTNQIGVGSYKMRSEYFSKKGVEMVPTDNLVDIVWGEDKPGKPNEKVWILEDKYAG
jgi:Xaa-Pro aminopeptidase